VIDYTVYVYGCVTEALAFQTAYQKHD